MCTAPLSALLIGIRTMAEANSPFTVLLVGRTGMGKSSTGNKLMDAATEDCPNGKGKIERVWPLESEGSEGSLHFATNSGIDSVTHHCELLVSKLQEGESVRVLDSEGFAGSDVKGDVRLGNLQIAREIAGVSNELQLTFDKVLYFLPMRGRPERADGTLQEEIGVMWHFFGENMFKNVVIGVTLQEGIPSSYAPKVEAIQKVFSECMKLALERDFVSKPPPPCPPVYFIPLETDNLVLLKGLKAVKVQGGKAFKPEFSEVTCAKCSSPLYWQKDDKIILSRPGDSFHDAKKVATMCHPIFIPKHSKLVRFFGGIAHIAVLGSAKVHEKRTGKRTWPGFFNKEEICANCEKAPGSKGCMKVDDSNIKYKDEVVQHSSNVQDTVLDKDPCK